MVAWWLVVFGLAWLLAVVPVRRLLLRDVHEQVADDLEAEIEGLRAVAASFDQDATAALLESHLDQQVPQPGEVFVAIDDGVVLAGSPASLAQQLATAERALTWSQVDDAEWGTLDGDLGEYRWLAVPVGEDGAYVVAADLGAQRADTNRTIAIFSILAGAALGLGALAAWALTPRAAQPGGGRRDRGGDRAPAVGETVDPSAERFQLVDASVLTDDVLDRVRSRHHRRDWHLTESADGDLLCDPERIHQAVINLADNAVQRTAAGASIDLSSRNDEEGVCFSVIDRDAAADAMGRGGRAKRVVVAANDGEFSMETRADEGAVYSFHVPRRPARGDGNE